MRVSPQSRRREVLAAALAFSVTMIAFAAVSASGLGDRGFDFMSRNVAPEVVLFVAPTLAIVLAMFALAVRLAWHGSVPEARDPQLRRLRWRSAHAARG
jgi:hypothetical protein